MDLPEPVGPTSATVRPAGTVKATTSSTCDRAGAPRRSYAKRTPSKRRAAGRRRRVERRRRRRASRRSASSTRLHPVPAGDAARQLGQHPADRPHREGQHGEEERDADQLGDGDRALPQPDRADHQHGQGAEAGQRLQQRVEDAAQPADRRSARRAARRPGRRTGRSPAASRPMVLTTSAPSKLSWAMRADLGPQPLGPGLPGRHPAGVDDVEREQRREDGQPDQGERPVGDEERRRPRRPASPACRPRTAAARSDTRPPRRRSWRWTAACRWRCGGARTAAAPGSGG